MTQQQVGDRFDPPVDKGTISRWETTARGLTINSLAAYAEAIGVQPSALYHKPNDDEDLEALAARVPRQERRTARRLLRALVEPD